MQNDDVNVACAALVKVARRSMEQHEARVVQLKRLIAMAEEVGAVESAEHQPNDELGAEILRAALVERNRGDQRANGRPKTASDHASNDSDQERHGRPRAMA